ncbi:MAG: peptidylprolyl isomerase [Flavobacteriales bacterium]
MNILKACFILSLLPLGSSLIAQDPKGQVIDEIVGVVGAEIVLKSEVASRKAEMKQEGYKVDQDAECTILEEILYQKLLVNQAKIDSILVGEEEVESQIERRLDYYISQFPDEKQFEAFYGKTASQLKEDFRDEVKDQLLTQRMQANITQGVNVTPNDVENYFNSIPKDSLPLIESEVQYAQIVIKPKVQRTEELIVQEKLDGYKQELLASPYKFGIYATLYSDDPGSANSQNLGCYRKIQRGTMVPEFEEAVLNLQPGEITEPFKTDFGWHIARLEEKSGKYYSVCHILNKVEILELDNQQAKMDLDTVRQLILSDSLSFFDASGIYSNDKDTKNAGGKVINPYTGGTKHELSKVDPRVTLVLNKLQPGEISEPVQFENQAGTKEYRIFKLIDRSKAHIANLDDDYRLLKQVAESDLQNEALEKWIKKKLSTTYKRLNEDYQTCPYRYEWVVN